jgi:hypothetical protein
MKLAEWSLATLALLCMCMPAAHCTEDDRTMRGHGLSAAHAHAAVRFLRCCSYCHCCCFAACGVPAELVALEREVGGLMAQQAAAEARKAALDMQVRAA